MEALSKRSVIVTKPRMTFWERIYFPAIIGGMMVTLKHYFKRKVTVNYPEKQRGLNAVYRGHHVLKRDDEGRERCTACGLCALSCPAEAITMIAAERLPGEDHLDREEKYAAVYEINMLRCIFCGFCEEACPKEAIFLTPRIVMPEYQRALFVYGKDRLLEPLNARIDVSLRQTPAVLEFKKIKELRHNL
jgi:NADH-quinone oxidoreductase subunit I